MSKEKKLRNQKCICESGKKWKNCHEPIFQKAERNIKDNENAINNQLNKLLRENPDSFPAVNGKYPVKKLPMKDPHIVIYLLCDVPCIKCDYTGMPISLTTISDYEFVAELDIRTIKREIIFKKPEKTEKPENLVQQMLNDNPKELTQKENDNADNANKELAEPAA